MLQITKWNFDWMKNYIDNKRQTPPPPSYDIKCQTPPPSKMINLYMHIPWRPNAFQNHWYIGRGYCIFHNCQHIDNFSKPIIISTVVKCFQKSFEPEIFIMHKISIISAYYIDIFKIVFFPLNIFKAS